MIEGYVMQDHYGCLSPEDSGAWLALFYLAEKHVNRELCDILQYIRNTGARLERNERYGYVIRPVIGMYGWRNMKQYEREKKPLEKYRREVISLLKKLAQADAERK